MQERTVSGLSDGLGVTAPRKGQRIRRMSSMCGVGFFGPLDNFDFVLCLPVFFFIRPLSCNLEQ